MKISIPSFNGVSPRSNPRYLPDSGAQIALNVEAWGQSVKPLKGLSAASAATPVSGAKTIYRAAMDSSSDSNYWFSWASNRVDMVSSQIAGDSHYWHFWTDPSATPTYPQATCKEIVGSGPADYFRLGLPAPTNRLEGAVNYAEREKHPAKLIMTPLILAEFVTWNFQTQMCDVQVALDRTGSCSNTAYHDEASCVANGGTWTWDENSFIWFMPTSINNALLDHPVITCPESTIAQFTKVTGLLLSIDDERNTRWIDLNGISETLNATNVAAAINAQALIGGQLFVDATVGGTTLTLTPRVAGGPVRFVLRWGDDDVGQRIVQRGTPISSDAAKSAFDGDWKQVGGTRIVHVPDYLDIAVDGSALVVSTKNQALWGGGTCTVQPWDTKESCTEHGGTWTPGAVIALRWGPASYQQMMAYGWTEDGGVMSSHSYIYTWLAIPGFTGAEDDTGYGLVMESAPSPPSDIANVYSDSTVLYQLFDDPDGAGPLKKIWPDGYEYVASGTNGVTSYVRKVGDDKTRINAVRFYRSVEGIYLFVKQLSVKELVTPIATTDANGHAYYCYADTIKAADLGEECPSLLWTEPPADLEGLMNMPNGMMAGFKGRDLYVCDPYHPYAWPEANINTLDYPIVGLGRMDTTVAVLTTGSTYFVQGSAPETLIVVKSDMEQSCVSKRSIVSMGGLVLYASPDGLIMLRPGGSDILTSPIFDRTQWQAILGASPGTTFHAYGHDDKYIAFHADVVDAIDNTVTYKGFVVDLRAKQLIRHNVACSAGFNDLLNDYLYVVPTGTTTIVKWGEGSNLTGRWRSKKFHLPQITGFSCAQVEAETYDSNLTCKLYRDGVLATTELTAHQVNPPVGSRRIDGHYPFRLEPQQGRDWEVDLGVSQEIYNVAIAQSMSEIAEA